jgi:hypothetical protein
LFGELTGEMVAYGYSILNGSAPNTDAFLDAVQQFAVLNSVLGFSMLVLTYLSVWTYNFVGSRQVRTLFYDTNILCYTDNVFFSSEI